MCVPTELKSLFSLREESQFLNSKLGSRIHNVGTIDVWRVHSREFGGVPGSSGSLSINCYEMALSRPRFVGGGGGGTKREHEKSTLGQQITDTRKEQSLRRRQVRGSHGAQGCTIVRLA